MVELTKGFNNLQPEICDFTVRYPKRHTYIFSMLIAEFIEEI